MGVCRIWYVAFTPSMYKNILLTEKNHLKKINLLSQDVMFCFNLVATNVLEYSLRENYFWVSESQAMRVSYRETYF